MKILHVNYYDSNGGAARACCRLHKGLKNHDIDSRVLVIDKQSEDESVIEAADSKMKLMLKFLQKLSFEFCKLQNFTNNLPHSLNFFPNRIYRKINKINPDIVHLHWINGEMLSIKDLSRINGKIVWTLHDEWAFCATEHYKGDSLRYKNGYLKDNKEDSGIDIDRFIWQRKVKYWKNLAFNIATPSNWLGKSASESILFGNENVSVIPNGLDLNIFKVGKKGESRKYFKLPENKKLIAFGAANVNDMNKGGKELEEIINIVSKQCSGIEIIMVGGGADVRELSGIKVNNLGFLTSEEDIVKFYSAADVFILPSKQDNLPNMIMEAMACGTPCIGFNTGGIPDMIKHEINGYLAMAFDCEDFAHGINWILNNSEYVKKCQNARKIVEDKFEIKKVAAQYIKFYKNILDSNGAQECL